MLSREQRLRCFDMNKGFGVKREEGFAVKREEGFAEQREKLFEREEGFAGSVRVSVRECMHEEKKKREDIRAREK